MPGYRVEIVDGEGKPVEPNTEGNIVIGLPLPPGTLAGLWRDEERFRRSYLDTFPGYYLTGDSGFVDEDGYVFVLGRSDDVINVAGHRLSTGSMEAVVASHPAVAECAVVGIRDTPAPGTSIPDCLAKHPDAYSSCDGTRAAWLPKDPLVDAVGDLHTPTATVTDLTDHTCLPSVCPAATGGVPVYFDGSHLTATYSLTLAPFLAPSLRSALAR